MQTWTWIAGVMPKTETYKNIQILYFSSNKVVPSLKAFNTYVVTLKQQSTDRDVEQGKTRLQKKQATLSERQPPSPHHPTAQFQSHYNQKGRA